MGPGGGTDQTWQQVPFTCSTLLLISFQWFLKPLILHHPSQKWFLFFINQQQGRNPEHTQWGLSIVSSPPLISWSPKAKIANTKGGRMGHKPGDKREQVSEGTNSAWFKPISLLTTAAISAPVLWFKAANTIEAIKKKKVLSPVLTKS